MKKIFVIALMLVVFLGGSTYYEEKKENTQLIEFIKGLEFQRARLTSQTVEVYEQEVFKGLDQITNRYDLKKAYYVLGSLAFYRSDYETSNLYFSKALSMNSLLVTNNLDSKISMGISTNYLYLGEDIKSEEFFEEAVQLAVQSKDNDLLAHLYRKRAEGFLNLSTNVEQVANLLDQVLKLSRDNSEKIECYLLLKDIYLGSLRLEESNKAAVNAFMLAKEEKDKTLETHSLIGIIINQYVSGNYAQVLELYEELLFKQQTKIPLYALGPYLISYGEEYGIEKALTFLEEERLNTFLEDNPHQSEYVAVIKATLYAKSGEKEKVLDILESLDNLTQDSDELYLLNVFMKKAYADAMLEGEALIECYDSLYEGLTERYPNLALRVIFLQRLIEENLKIENYKDALYYSQQMYVPMEHDYINNLNVGYKEFESLVQQEMEYTSNEVSKGLLIFVSISLISLFMYYHQKQYGILSHKIREQYLKEVRNQEEIGLLTIQNLYERIEKWFEQNTEGTVIVIDLDDFQKYNETYGYVAGDKVIKQISNLIREVFKTDLIARYNGQQFIIVTKKNDVVVLEKAQQLVDKTYELNLEHVTNLVNGRMTVSVGISSAWLNSSIKLDQCIKRAQDLVLISKETGKNRFTI